MTSSDKTVLAQGTVERYEAQVGSSVQGESEPGEPTPFRVTFVCAKFNGGITDRLLRAAIAVLTERGVERDSIGLVWVPGAFEIPSVAKLLAMSGEHDVIVALGAVIRGGTPHFDFVAGECAAGLQRAALDTGVPVVFGVLTTDTVEQALERSGEGEDNKGREAAVTALEMASLFSRLGAVTGRMSASTARAAAR
ncbi:MAG TPA: 6,7-dimethyl-8-ribityllumazine synthase [Acidimicrobiales bacterium]|nr:6,7-dimethyl-8-ribityllumazine synthase [Acidimicrobiales bacterium]